MHCGGNLERQWKGSFWGDDCVLQGWTRASFVMSGLTHLSNQRQRRSCVVWVNFCCCFFCFIYFQKSWSLCVCVCVCHTGKLEIVWNLPRRVRKVPVWHETGNRWGLDSVHNKGKTFSFLRWHALSLKNTLKKKKKTSGRNVFWIYFLRLKFDDTKAVARCNISCSLCPKVGDKPLAYS